MNSEKLFLLKYSLTSATIQPWVFPHGSRFVTEEALISAIPFPTFPVFYPGCVLGFNSLMLFLKLLIVRSGSKPEEALQAVLHF